MFGLRVLAQWIQFVSPVGFIPPFEAWQGSRLSYPVLLGSQLLILGILIWGAARIGSGRALRNPRLGCWLIVVGTVYFLTMAMRLALGLTLLAAVPWFAKSLPASFHMVLASYMLVAGHYHWSRSGGEVE